MGWERWPQCPRPDQSYTAIGSQLNSNPACGAGSGTASVSLGWGTHPKEKPRSPSEGLCDAFILSPVPTSSWCCWRWHCFSQGDEAHGQMVLIGSGDSACATGTAGWGFPCPTAREAPWFHLGAPGTGKVRGFCLVLQAGTSEPGCRDLGDTCTAFSLCVCLVLVVQSLTP